MILQVLGLQVPSLTSTLLTLTFTIHSFMWCWTSMNVWRTLTTEHWASLASQQRLFKRLSVCNMGRGAACIWSSEERSRTLFSPSTYTVAGVKPRSWGLHSKHLYLVSQLASPVNAFNIDKNQLCVFAFPSNCCVTCGKSEILLPVSLLLELQVLATIVWHIFNP